MNRRMSGVIFIRALLWLLLAYMALQLDASRAFVVADMMLGVYNIIKSYMIWRAEE